MPQRVGKWSSALVAARRGSVVLLAASAVYELMGFACADALGAVGPVYLCLQEGREALEQARFKSLTVGAGQDPVSAVAPSAGPAGGGVPLADYRFTAP